MYTIHVFYIISPIYYSLQMFAYGYGVEKIHALLSLYNFNTTYHFLDRRQIALTIQNYQFKYPPLFLLFLNG
jgi:hypothetical protein